MGETSRELQHDLRELRADVNRVLAEMNLRLAEVTDVRSQTRRHPYLFLGSGAALLAGVAALTYGIWTRAHGPSGDGWAPPSSYRDRTGDPLGVQPGARGNARSSGQDHRPLPRSDGVVKRLAWGVLASVVLTVTAYLSRRMLETAWIRTRREAPPAR